MEFDERFKRVSFQSDEMAQAEFMVFVDTITGVNYLYVHSVCNTTNGTPCIIPLVNADGKLSTTNLEEI